MRDIFQTRIYSFNSRVFSLSPGEKSSEILFQKRKEKLLGKNSSKIMK